MVMNHSAYKLPLARSQSRENTTVLKYYGFYFEILAVRTLFQ